MRSRGALGSAGNLWDGFDPEAAVFDDALKKTDGRSKKRTPLGALYAVLSVAVLILCLWSDEGSAARYTFLVLGCCGHGFLCSVWLWRWLASRDGGDAAMLAISDPIAEGASGFLRVQYAAISRLSVGLSVLIGLSYQLRASPEKKVGGVAELSPTLLGCLASVCFLVGAVFSAASGYVSMLVAASCNVKVCAAARKSSAEALVICFRGGVFSAVLNLTLCVIGLVVLMSGIAVCGFVREPQEVPLLLVGYGFGASFVALFMQLGGGIYTKAADVGADLVGKVELSIPEDDPRNPAVIADLVGDMVGDCVGSSADVFESVAAEMIGAMILGGRLARDAQLPQKELLGFVFFPLVVHALDIVASSIGALSVNVESVKRLEEDSKRRNVPLNSMIPLFRGYRLTLLIAMAGFTCACKTMLSPARAPQAWLHFLACGATGFLTALVCSKASQYYTDYEYEPVRRIAQAATTGHGTVLITGLAVGLESTVVPIATVACAVVSSYHLGRTSGILTISVNNNAGFLNGGASLSEAGLDHAAGLFGTAVATMGMLATAVYILSMNNFGPIADNAGGIAEMSQQPASCREATDALDAAGNCTKAITKGYSIASAALACFLLFGAFMDEFEQFSGRPFRTVDIAKPEVLVGGLLGVMMIFAFAGMAIAAVGRTAAQVVVEVRRQFEERPNILKGTERPDYRTCVALVTEAALREMRLPGCLCVAAPVAVGLLGRLIGEATDRPMLGAEVLAGYLMLATVTGIVMALFLDNVGGAWDNAKKFVELGNFGGKGSEAHKAAVTGDTVGDPLKDTAGPSLHVVIKLLSTTVLVLGPLFVGSTSSTT